MMNNDTAPTLFHVQGWTTEQLVAFGNYMLSRYPEKLVDSLDNDGVITPVTDADIANWRALSSI